VAPGGLELRPTIDRGWLEGEAARDPLAHAYALWDLLRAPDRIRVVSAVEEDRTIGYLLVWLGHPRAPVVHWAASDPRSVGLAEALPPRPLVAIVPERFRDAVVRARGPAREYPLLGLYADRVPVVGGPPEEAGVRRIQRRERSLLARFAARQDDPVVAEYAQLDPGAEPIWGAFLGPQLTGVVHAAVRLPSIWVLGGVYVEPTARGQGFGRALVRTAQRAAAADGAPAALFVREDRTPARALYESLGFRPVASRRWLDLGAGLAP
jgi:ribosomal protein S18 acetylase RimI-like enzyme